jgi:biotin-(acetyl-CoA carboxylase) ligase
MPTELRSRIHTPYTGRLDLPPGFSEVPLREAGDAFGHAEKIATKEGAGTLVWVRRFDVVEFAVVLEPEEPLAGARRTFYVAQCALFDALASHAPPDKNIRFVWPDAVLVDGGLVAGSQIGWPARADEKQPPRWLVFGAMVRSAIMGGDEPGARPDVASLEEEGFDELGSGRLVETFARHLLTWTDVWQQEGYRPVFEHYLGRLEADEPVERSIDGFGNLLIRRKGKLDTSKKQLLPALEKRDWYDEDSRGLKL